MNAPHYYRTKLTTAPLRRETHKFLLKLLHSESVLFASIHSLTSVLPHGVRICACVSHIRYHSLVCFGGVESIFKTCENCECLWVENVQVCPYCEVSTHSERVSCEFSSVRDVSPDESPHLNESEPKSAAPYWGCDATTHCPPSPHLLLHHQRGREKHRKSTGAS